MLMLGLSAVSPFSRASSASGQQTGAYVFQIGVVRSLHREVEDERLFSTGVPGLQ